MRQFWRGLHATVTDAELAQVDALLPPDAAALFRRMPTDAQRHSLNVLADVATSAVYDRSLAAAALLHDVGKLAADRGTVRLGLWLRGPLVLLEAFAPAWVARLARPEPRHGWRYVLHVHVHHPAIGAAWAAEAGCDAACCRLIEYHQTAPAECPPGAWRSQLVALQAADAAH